MLKFSFLFFIAFMLGESISAMPKSSFCKKSGIKITVASRYSPAISEYYKSKFSSSGKPDQYGFYDPLTNFLWIDLDRNNPNVNHSEAVDSCRSRDTRLPTLQELFYEPNSANINALTATYLDDVGSKIVWTSDEIYDDQAWFVTFGVDHGYTEHPPGIGAGWALKSEKKAVARCIVQITCN